MSLDALPSEVPALAAVVLLLGIRHGLDADHLATIDALTRLHMPLRPRLARRAGALFSLGHGAVVVAVASVVGAWLPPSGRCRGGWPRSPPGPQSPA